MITKANLDELSRVERDISHEEFKNFGNLQDHLWRQFSTTYRHNLLAFYRYLNDDEREILITIINHYMPEQ